MTPSETVTIQTGLVTAMSATLDVTLFLALRVSKAFYRVTRCTSNFLVPRDSHGEHFD